MKNFIYKRLGNLLSVKSLVTLTLTAVFAVMALKGTISQDFMTVYAVVIAFYFGTQSQKVQDAQAGVKLPARTASCGTLMNAAKSFGIWVTEGFQPGDVAIYDFSGKRRTTAHCGIVEAVLPGYGVQAIEGNTSESGSQSNGGMVCRKKRPWTHIVGAVRPDFTEEDDMTGEEIYNKLNDYLRDKPAPAWAQAELAEAVALGITDGKNPMQLIPRYQAAIMAKRAAQR